MDKALGLVTGVKRCDWKPVLWELLRDAMTLMFCLLGSSWANTEEALCVLNKEVRARAPS